MSRRKASDCLRKNRSKTLAQTDTVSVIIPAYNASRTIRETLESAAAQTHRALEILVVDDGSSDETPAIVEGFASGDPRVRLIPQANGGVAAARNSGIAASSAEFIAPLDSDDLWHPTKIARQLDIFATGGPDIGLVYTWFALIDDRSRVKQLRHHPEHQGEVLAPLAFHNFIGNGSSALIRRSALAHTEGYDSSLRRGGRTGRQIVLSSEQMEEICRRTPAEGDIDHGAHDEAHHVMQKPIGLDREHQSHSVRSRRPFG